LPFVGYDPLVDPAPPQASEVVRMDLLDAQSTLLKSSFKFSFAATRTDQGATDCFNGTGDPADTCSYTGNYEVSQVPGPGTGVLVLLGVSGLAGVRTRMRRAPRAAWL
jgi:hypothetical protein